MPTETNEQLLARWKSSLPVSVDVAGLLSRAPLAHKWKAPYRSLVIREALIWRMQDLGEQIEVLSENQFYLGARVLLRSALETLAILIYLNQKMLAVVDGKQSFSEFNDATIKLLTGSKDESTSEDAVNILTALKKAENVHEGLAALHENLSESAHPNFDGVLYGYSNSNPEKYETNFNNNWTRNFGAQQKPATTLVLRVFEHEYNQTWPAAFEALESWLEKNDAELEAQRQTSNN
ncbi:hypothetical protein [Solemya velum gill symbiont]|uniref:hypothetical protein n=1 Tax=Solemya velum gill symbiont TaxID=2340 RepID=UPI000998213D|nr:hypothetical protein [Solemya velum gill symbiont]OOZ44255.1 hypothetical protein BOW37_07700 [Solemya velum gill symbiont]OOZ48020.1 hypothetical protein BOW38_00725 [Solemya velum gill symbiont]OOZ51045.1 hypothetical protein BOW39_00020 [Solemya velum gill symbiont]OOZ52962.1 hypothetical protein BOW40_00725 [Solemya velum gill symbiont]OOZ55605.1 hypothetical protein BOW42_09555 [Solemya velum gill symbiont]